MSTGTNKERITENNGIISENNADLTALKTRIDNLPTSGDTTATADDIAVGKTAVSKGVKLTGTLQPGIDTSDATAVAKNITYGATAYVNGVKVTGTLPVLTYPVNPEDPSDWDYQFQASAGNSLKRVTRNNINYILGTYTVVNNQVQEWSFQGNSKMKMGFPEREIAAKVNLTSDKLKKDETILGVTGTYEGLDTSDATATAGDMASGKTAYVDGVKIEGNVEMVKSGNHALNTYAGLWSFPDPNCIATRVTFPQDYLCKKNSGTIAQTPYSEIVSKVNLTSNKLKKGETILGVTGTYEGSSGLDWSAIGYSGVPQEVTNGFNHAQSIMQNWTVKSDYSNECEEDIDLIFMPLVDTSSATTMQEMFLNCYSLITVPLLNTSNVTNMEDMFCDCGALQSVPVFDTSNVTNMEGMFNNCTSLKTVPAFDTSNVTNMRAMFSGCDALQSIPILNFEQVENTSSMFAGCLSLTTIPDVDIEASNLINTSGMFSGCTSLEIIPDHFDIPEAQNCSSMFANCTSLTTVPMFSLEGVNSMSNMFSNCPLLSEDSLDNILGMLAYATEQGYSRTKTLKWIGLSQSQASICETLRHWSDCQETGWETGY